jgi:hypothetical protein
VAVSSNFCFIVLVSASLQWFGGKKQRIVRQQPRTLQIALVVAVSWLEPLFGFASWGEFISPADDSSSVKRWHVMAPLWCAMRPPVSRLWSISGVMFSFTC